MIVLSEFDWDTRKDTGMTLNASFFLKLLCGNDSDALQSELLSQ